MQDILPLAPSGSSPINDFVSFTSENGTWTYHLGLHPFFSHPEDDRRSFRFVVGSLIVSGACRPRDLIKFFGVTKQKVLRAAKQLRETGPPLFSERERAKKAEPFSPARN